MKIYSKFTDYYDHIGFNAGDTRVWVRETKYIKLNIETNSDRLYTGISNVIESKLRDIIKKFPQITTKSNSYGWHYSNIADYMCMLGFCGRIYVGIVRHITSGGKIFYTDFNKYVMDYNKDNPNRILNISNSRSYYSDGGFNETSFNALASQYNGVNKFDDVFIELKSPIFIIKVSKNRGDCGYENIIINPVLQDYKFQTYFDPYQAHQEIDMYLNNVLTDRENCDIIRTDDLIRDSKGMDNWSFKQVGPKARKRK